MGNRSFWWQRGQPAGSVPCPPVEVVRRQTPAGTSVEPRNPERGGHEDTALAQGFQIAEETAQGGGAEGIDLFEQGQAEVARHLGEERFDALGGTTTKSSSGLGGRGGANQSPVSTPMLTRCAGFGNSRLVVNGKFDWGRTLQIRESGMRPARFKRRHGACGCGQIQAMWSQFQDGIRLDSPRNHESVKL